MVMYVAHELPFNNVLISNKKGANALAPLKMESSN